ncbi:MAG: CBS domain-containing protein [Gammaproteobacteria bacterium]|nr:CBS domain-containing protein [Gammaproteobacteria bacterium]
MMSGNPSSSAPRKPTLANTMTAFPYTVAADAKLDEARLLMHEHHIRHLPVMRAGELVGVVSDRDIKLGMAVGAELQAELGSPLVGDVCSDRVYQADIHTPLQQVAEQMHRNHLGSAVVTRNDKVVGMFTATDACRCLDELLQEPSPPENDVA